MSWNIQNASNPNVLNITTGTAYSDANKLMTNVGRQITRGQNTIQALNGTTLLRQITVAASCPAAAPWNSISGVCFPTLSIFSGAPLVRQNSTTKISWTISGLIPAGYTCTINGAGLKAAAVSTQNGSLQSGPLRNQVEVTLRCSNNSVTVTDSITIEIVPQIQEV